MKTWILCVFFSLAFALGVSAQSDEAAFPDYWEADYNDQWYQEELEKLGILSSENKDAPEDDNNFNDYDDTADVGNQEKSQDEMDEKVENDIEKFKRNEFKEDDDNVNDYQFEDNRSELEEKVEAAVDDGKKSSEKVELIRDIDDIHNVDDSVSANDNDYDDYAALGEGPNNDNLQDADQEDKEIQYSKDDDIAPLPIPPQSSDEIKQILEETKNILSEEEQQPNDFIQEEIKEDGDDEFKDIIGETKKILEETKDEFDETLGNTDQIDKPEQVVSKKESQENIDNEMEKKIDENFSDNIVDKDEDTVDKVYEDLNDDLDTLFETLNKLANSEDTENKVEPQVDYAVNSDESLDDKVDYENVFDSNLSELFAQHSKTEDVEPVSNENKETEKLNEDVSVDESAANVEEKKPDLYVNDADNVFDSKLSQLFAQDSKAEVVEPISNENKESEKLNENVSIDESATDMEEKEPVPYVNDAIVSAGDVDDAPIKSVSVDELTDDQLVQLMKEFAVQHSDALDVELSSDDHMVNNLALEYGDVLVIETDNYPAGYPTNRVVDWIITGKGMGIELNITDFAVNSALGDYLLVKPGQADASGPDGILFSYQLNQPRAYRFMDVDRLFLRFDAKDGFSFLRGFSLTVSMIAPPPAEPELLPEPEPVLPEPHSPLSIVLGGLTLQEFTAVREDFRLLIADMATMYINANKIDPGMNTTAEITQIISASVCNVHWPGYEQCADVRVAVPLVYEDYEGVGRLSESELEDMWNTYVDQDPFASRLRQMGIEEFSVPNDGGVMTVWLVVALGVLVSAAMLALALWRYTCFKDYSRMPAFSDTDSLNEKRGLDLYPTPHQTLPPLYSENEYKWDKYDDATRVDMGGYANRSYVRSDMYDLDSDEEVEPRDRNAAKPKDISSV